MASNGTMSPDLLRVYERFALPVFPMVGDTGFEPVSRGGSVRSVLNLLSRLGGPR